MMFPATGILPRMIKTLVLPAIWPAFFYACGEENCHASTPKVLSVASNVRTDANDNMDDSGPSPSPHLHSSPSRPASTSLAFDSHQVSVPNSRDASSISLSHVQERTHADVLRDLDARGIKHRDFAYLPALPSNLPEKFYVKDHAWAYEVELLDQPHRTEAIHLKRLFRLIDSGYYRLEEEQMRWSELERTAFSAYVQSGDAKKPYHAIWAYYPGSLCKTYRIAPLELKRSSDPTEAPRWVRPKHPHRPGHSAREPGYFDKPPPGDLETAEERYYFMRLWLRYKTEPPPPKPLAREGTESETEGEDSEDGDHTIIDRLQRLMDGDEPLPELRGRRHGGAFVQPSAAQGNRALRRDYAIVATPDLTAQEVSEREPQWTLEDLVGGGRVGDIVKKKGKVRAGEATMAERVEPRNTRPVERNPAGFQGVDTPGAGPSMAPSRSLVPQPPPVPLGAANAPPPPPPNPNGQRRLGLTRTYASVWRDL